MFKRNICYGSIINQLEPLVLRLSQKGLKRDMHLKFTEKTVNAHPVLFAKRLHSVSKLQSKEKSNSTCVLSPHHASKKHIYRTFSSQTHDGPLSVYMSQVSSGELNPDLGQQAVVERLQNLHEQLKTYTPSGTDPGVSWFGSSAKPEKSLNGIYLFGSVGTGKTMLMDLFHDTSTVKRRKRVHFHKFMLDVHKRIHALKKKQPKISTTRGKKPFDPITPVAAEISKQAWLLCFDEFQVTDVADAMIVKRLFTGLFANGVVVVATSNRHPDDLYKNGLQRGTFLPFIDVIKNHSDVICLDAGIDYRMKNLASEGKIFFVGTPEETTPHIQNIIDDYIKDHRTGIEPKTLTVMGRKLHLPRTCGRVLDTTFMAMCKENLGAIDYLEISKEFEVVILRDIPELNLNNRTEARRFITLIDTFYDHKIKLVASAAAPIKSLFSTGNIADHEAEHHMTLMDDLGISAKSELANSSIFTGEEELFAFERVVSRLTEMQTEEYWKIDQRVLKEKKHQNSELEDVSIS